MLHRKIPFLHVLVLHLGVHRINRRRRAGKKDAPKRASLSRVRIGGYDRGALEGISKSERRNRGTVVHSLRRDKWNRRLGVVQSIIVWEVIDDAIRGADNPIGLGAPGQPDSWA